MTMMMIQSFFIPPSALGFNQWLHLVVTVADILTGFYLIALALKDIETRNSYSSHAYEWTTSGQCTAIGVLAMISCEVSDPKWFLLLDFVSEWLELYFMEPFVQVSLLILTMMSLERYLVISGPFAAPKLGRTLALSSMAIIWIFVTGLAITPREFELNVKCVMNLHN